MDINDDSLKKFSRILNIEDKILSSLLVNKGISFPSLEKYDINYIGDLSISDFLQNIKTDKNFFSFLVKYGFIDINADTNLVFNFKDSIIFPIKRDGALIGFVGENDTSKTFSPRSQLFSPFKTFFALDENLESSIEKKSAYVCDSFLDCVAFNQFNRPNTLAPINNLEDRHLAYFEDNKITPNFIIQNSQIRNTPKLIKSIANGIYSKCTSFHADTNISSQLSHLTSLPSPVNSHIVLANLLADDFINSKNEIAKDKYFVDSENAIYNLQTLFSSYYTPYLNETISILKERLSKEHLCTKQELNAIFNPNKNTFFEKHGYFQMKEDSKKHIALENKIFKSFVYLFASSYENSEDLLSKFFPNTSQGIEFKEELSKVSNLDDLINSSFDLTVYADYSNNFIGYVHQLINNEIKPSDNVSELIKDINEFHHSSQEIVHLTFSADTKIIKDTSPMYHNNKESLLAKTHAIIDEMQALGKNKSPQVDVYEQQSKAKLLNIRI